MHKIFISMKCSRCIVGTGTWPSPNNPRAPHQRAFTIIRHQHAERTFRPSDYKNQHGARSHKITTQRGKRITRFVCSMQGLGNASYSAPIFQLHVQTRMVTPNQQPCGHGGASSHALDTRSQNSLLFPVSFLAFLRTAFHDTATPAL
jgi:hypothetical protein